MAEVTRRRTGELLRHAFALLLEHPDGLPGREVIDHVAGKVTLSPYEAGSYDNGGRRFDTIIRYATVDCVKAGWMVKQHGRWTLTEEGRSAYETLTEPEAFYRRAVRLYAAWKKGMEGKEHEGTTPAEDNDGAVTGPAAITFEQAEEQAWTQIERHVTTMPPYEFQDLVAALLRAMGYHVGWVAPPGKDGGVDILAFNDPLGTRPPRMKVQVKRQQQKVTVDGLRAFMAVVGADEVGVFVNTGGFTDDAKGEARAQHGRRVTLVDLERLVDLWTEHYARLDETGRRRLPLQPIYFLAPES
jgi:restriction system protein